MRVPDSFYCHAESFRAFPAWYWKGYRAWETKGIGYRSVKVPRYAMGSFYAGVDAARHRCHEEMTDPGCNVGVLVHPCLPC